MMSRFLPDRRHGQKDPQCAREQNRPDISRHRKRWRTYQGLIDPRRAWCSSMKPLGRRLNMTCSAAGLKGRAPRRQGSSRPLKTATFLAALRNDRIDAPCLFDGPINGERLYQVEQ